MRIIYTAGVWDLFHIGHLNLLRKSKALGDKLIVGVVSNKGAQEYKREPIIPENERLQIIRSIRYVDEAHIQMTTDPTPNLKKYKPHVMTHGSDWKQLLKGQKTLEKMGIEFVILPYTNTISTTLLTSSLK